MVRAPDSMFFIFIYEWKLLAQLDVYHRVRKNHREKTMKSLIEYVKIIGELLLILIPRHVTDRVALNHNDGTWSVVCLEGQEHLVDNSFIHAHGTIKTFTWFGVARGGMVKLDEKL
tara:strand:- start:41 stop:388 length:348 start_codon:yes stop_codon:yes gene_type:complete